MDIRVDEDIRRAEGLPAECFTAEPFLDRELGGLFRRSWLLVPDTTSRAGADERSLPEQLAARGSRLPVSLVGRSLFLQRGWDDEELRLFPNTCTHAWYPLVSGPSRGSSLTCAQHGRKFDCAGRFVSQPGFEDVADFPRDCDHLRALEVREWNGLLMACLGEPSAPLDDVLEPVTSSIARLPLDQYRREPRASSARELDGNWKLHAWNYMDSYHVTWIHRAPGGLADRVDMTSYRTELHGRCALQWAYARDPSHGFAPELLPDRFRDPGGRRVFALWWLVFPNLTLNFYPWGLSVNCYSPVPGRPERTLFLWEHFVGDAALYERRDEIWLNAQVDAEDVDALAQVRRGLRSGDAPRPRFSPERETGPHWFHRLVAEELRRG